MSSPDKASKSPKTAKAEAKTASQKQEVKDLLAKRQVKQGELKGFEATLREQQAELDK